MCGRLNVTDSPGVRQLCDQLEISFWPEEGMQFSRFVRATERVTIVLEQQGKRVARNAIWCCCWSRNTVPVLRILNRHVILLSIPVMTSSMCLVVQDITPFDSIDVLFRSLVLVSRKKSAVK